MSTVLWKKRRILLFVPAVVIALFLAALAYIFSTPIDLSSRHARIEAVIENRTGIRVTVESVTLKAFPHVDLRVKGVTAFHGKDFFLKIRSARLVMPLLALFSRGAAIDRLEADGVDLSVTRPASGESVFARLFKEAEPSMPGGLGIKTLNLSDARVSFKDDATGAAFDITAIGAAVARTPKGFDYTADASLEPGVRISFRGTGNDGGKGLKFSGTLNVKGFDLSSLAPYLRQAFAGASLKGRAGLSSSYSYDAGLRAKSRLTYENARVELPGLLAKPLASESGSALITLSAEKKGALVVVDRASLAFDGFGLSGSLKVNYPAGAGPKNPAGFEAKLSSTPIQVRTALEYIPSSYKKILKMARLVDGTVAIDGLSASGTLNDIKDADAFKRPGFLDAAVRLGNVKIQYPGLERPFTSVRGVIAFKDNVLTLKNLSDSWGNVVIEDLSGEIRDPAGKADYRLSLRANAETAELVDLAKAFLKAHGTAAEIEKLDKARLAGRAWLTLEVKGAGHGLKEAAYAGSLRLKGVKASYAGIPAELRSVQGAVAFDNKRLTLKDVEATDEFKSVLHVNGSVENYLADRPVLSVHAEGTLAGETLSAALRKWGVEEPSYHGLMPIKAAVSGSPGSMNASVFLDFKPVAFEYRKILKKAAGVEASAKGSFALRGRELSVNGLTLSFGKAAVNVGGALSFDKDTAAYSLFAASKHVDIEDIVRVSALLEEGSSAGGFLDFNVKAEKKAGDEGPSYEGAAALRDGRFNAVFLAKPVDGVSASVKFGRGALHLAIDRLVAGRTSMSGSVDAENGVVAFALDSPAFYLEDLLKRPQGKPSETAETQGAAAKRGGFKKMLYEIMEPRETRAERLLTGNGTINIKKGGIFGRTFEDLSVRVNLTKEALYVTPLAFSKNNGRTEADLTLYRDAASPLLFKAKMEFSGVQMEPFFEEMGAKSKILSGPAHGTIELTGRRGASPFTAGINGQAHLGSENGRLYKFMLLNRIFSVVNILSITELFDEGLQYRDISGDFVVKDGIITNKNLRLDASAMRMSALGEINMPDATIDAVLALHPFVTIDKIITKIPLAGWIIGGKQKSALSMYYEITGPLKAPDIDPVPIRRLGAGVLGILQRIIEMPVELIRPEGAPK